MADRIGFWAILLFTPCLDCSPHTSKHQRLLSMKKVMVELRDSALVSFLESVDSGLYHWLVSGLCVMSGGEGEESGWEWIQEAIGAKFLIPVLQLPYRWREKMSKTDPPPLLLPLLWCGAILRQGTDVSDILRKGNKFCKPLVKQVCIMQHFSEYHIG